MKRLSFAALACLVWLGGCATGNMPAKPSAADATAPAPAVAAPAPAAPARFSSPSPRSRRSSSSSPPTACSNATAISLAMNASSCDAAPSTWFVSDASSWTSRRR